MKRRVVRSGLNPTFVGLCARIVVLSLVMQVAAIDHWGTAPHFDIVGVAGTNAHKLHCHGGPAGCGTSQTSVVAAPQPVTAIQLAATWRPVKATPDSLVPDGLAVLPLDPPPQAFLYS